MVLFQHLQHTQVRKSTREATAQGQSNSWLHDRLGPLERSALLAVRHASTMPAPCVPPNGSHVPEKQYGCTCLPDLAKNSPNF